MSGSSSQNADEPKRRVSASQYATVRSRSLVRAADSPSPARSTRRDARLTSIGRTGPGSRAPSLLRPDSDLTVGPHGAVVYRKRLE